MCVALKEECGWRWKCFHLTIALSPWWGVLHVFRKAVEELILFWVKFWRRLILHYIPMQNEFDSCLLVFDLCLTAIICSMPLDPASHLTLGNWLHLYTSVKLASILFSSGVVYSRSSAVRQVLSVPQGSWSGGKSSVCRYAGNCSSMWEL